MNILGILSLLWQVLKSTVANETVNKAMDNWVKGTSNEIDDMVWKLLEQATGVTDAETQKKMLEDGLESIEKEYDVAKLEGRVLKMRRTSRRWDPPTPDEIRALMTGETVEIGMG